MDKYKYGESGGLWYELKGAYYGVTELPTSISGSGGCGTAQSRKRY